MKITVDTNILVSATFWNGVSERIIEKVEKKEIVMVLSREIMEEFVKVLNYEEIQRKVRDKNLEMNRSVEKIAEISEFVDPKERLHVVKNDSSDDKFLECAKAGRVDYLISNDKHLLELREFEGIKILTAYEFLGIVK